MRARAFAIALCLCLMTSGAAFAQDMPNRGAVAVHVEKDSSGVYKLAWQRQLLAIQQAFVTKLSAQAGVDHTTTGSITARDPTRPPH